MVSLKIRASIPQNKQLEFSQSKLTFINDIQKEPGYLNFTEKPEREYHIIISWSDQNALDKFVSSETFSFFRGAIIALGGNNAISLNQFKNQKHQH